MEAFAPSLDEILFRIKHHGWCILRSVIPAEEVAKIRVDVERIAAEQGRARVEYALNHLRHDAHELSRYLASERVLAPVRAMFGGQHVRLRTNAGFVTPPLPPGAARKAAEVQKHPSARTMHADGPFLQQQPVRVAAPYQDATIQMTTIWMLSEFTAENGATVVLTGSHRSNTNPTALATFSGSGSSMTAEAADAAARMGDLSRPDPAIVSATGSPGDVVLFDNRLWHGGGPNLSVASPRVGLVMVYFPWWLCQDQNRPIGTPERARIKAETGLSDSDLGPGTPLLPWSQFVQMAEEVKPLLLHWLEEPMPRL
jgi:ectoine hydroxylase-related dioxygenase (phytanoyl-CoA dioxygenase family)